MEKLISEFSLGLFFWQSAIFLGLLFLLRRFAWKPILSAVNEREASIKDALDSAEEARIQMENLQSENQRLLKEARKEKEILIKDPALMDGYYKDSQETNNTINMYKITKAAPPP